MQTKRPELLVGAGDWKMLTTAVNAGADAVYFGVEELNMRAKANNFEMDKLDEVVAFCHENNVDAHLTVNAIVFDDQTDKLDNLLLAAKKAKADMIIAWDMAVIDKALEYNLPLCISTQASISNISAAKAYQRMGADRIVLAREVTLENIKKIMSY